MAQVEQGLPWRSSHLPFANINEMPLANVIVWMTFVSTPAYLSGSLKTAQEQPGTIRKSRRTESTLPLHIVVIG
jgi:hypothetical protein